MKNYNENVTCLADGYVFPFDEKESGINRNELIVGPTRCGKTMSVVEPKLLHSFENSIVVSVTKRALVDTYAPIFKERGYKVIDLNLVEPDAGNVGYDILANINTEEEINNLADTIIKTVYRQAGSYDPYWDEAAKDYIAAIIGLAIANAKYAGRKVCFEDFYVLQNASRALKNNEKSLDLFFEKLEDIEPGNMACSKWKTFQWAPEKTANTILSVANSALSDLLTLTARKMMRSDNQVDFSTLGKEKTVLFLTTSPVNRAMDKVASLFYIDMFRHLFEQAEKLPEKKWPVPVHVVCDDFATGCVIPDFEKNISIFCAKNISVTLLLQSESQLNCMYGKGEAATIINNCDTYLYMGGMDYETCHSISQRRNIPFDEVCSLELEQVILLRRGSKPISARRYQTLEDELYQELVMGA